VYKVVSLNSDGGIIFFLFTIHFCAHLFKTEVIHKELSHILVKTTDDKKCHDIKHESVKI